MSLSKINHLHVIDVIPLLLFTCRDFFIRNALISHINDRFFKSVSFNLINSLPTFMTIVIGFKKFLSNLFSIECCDFVSKREIAFISSFNLYLIDVVWIFHLNSPSSKATDRFRTIQCAASKCRCQRQYIGYVSDSNCWVMPVDVNLCHCRWCRTRYVKV